MIPEMNTSRKTMEWLICFSIVNFRLGCLLLKKFQKFNEFCSFLKATRMSSHIIKLKFRFVKVIFIKPLRFVKIHKDVSQFFSSNF